MNLKNKKNILLILFVLLLIVGSLFYHHSTSLKKESGTLIILHGISSSGKSSVATALQQLYADDNKPYLYIPMDGFLETVPKKWLSFNPHDSQYSPPEGGVRWIEEYEPNESTPRITTIVGSVINNAGLGMMHMLPVLAQYKNNVIFEGSFLRSWIDKEFEGLKKSVPMYIIRINVNREVAEQREQKRNGRIGLARSQLVDPEYVLDVYDFSIDTSTISSQEAALAIKNFIEQHKKSFLQPLLQIF